MCQGVNDISPMKLIELLGKVFEAFQMLVGARCNLQVN